MTDVFLTAFHGIPKSNSASEAHLYLKADHEAVDLKTSLRLRAKQNTQTQSDPGRLFLLISSEVLTAVLQCLVVIVIDSLQPCIPTQQLVHFLRLSKSAQSVPSSRLLAQTLFRGIRWCTKTSGFASEKWFSNTTQSVHNFAHNFMLKCCSFQITSDGGST